MSNGERERRDAEFQAIMEGARFTARALISPNLKKSQQGKSARSIFPFPWDFDPATDSEAVTKEDIEKSRERIRRRDKKKALRSAPFKG